MVMADFSSYLECQAAVSSAYGDREGWSRMSILNAAHSGEFSSDRTIREYCREIWRTSAVPIRLLTAGQVQSGLLQ
jgi:glycogen phosphorylase